MGDAGAARESRCGRAPFGVLHGAKALGSAASPAHAAPMLHYGVRSVVGCGGARAPSDYLAIILSGVCLYPCL